MKLEAHGNVACNLRVPYESNAVNDDEAKEKLVEELESLDKEELRSLIDVELYEIDLQSKDDN